MKRWFSIPAVFLVAACGVRQPVMGPSTYVEQKVSPFSITMASTVPMEHRRALQELIDTTLAITSSRQFADRMDSLGKPYRGLWLSPSGDVLSPAQVAQIYGGRHRRARPVPITVTFVDRGNAVTTFDDQVTPARATIKIPAGILANWTSNSLTRRSCAVNTMAHELTHTISSSDRVGTWVFEDGVGLRWARLMRRHLVSYTVGGVAQCIMLEHHRPLTGGFKECLRTWGKAPFPYCGASTAA